MAGADCWWRVKAKSSPLSGYLLPSDALILLTAVGVSVAGCARYVFVNSGMASAVVFHVGEQLSLPIVGDGDPHVMFRGIIRDAAPVAGDFPDGVVVRSRPRVGDGVEQDVAPLVVGLRRADLTACLVLDACELVLSGLQLDACMVGVRERLAGAELHADRLRLIRVR